MLARSKIEMLSDTRIARTNCLQFSSLASEWDCSWPEIPLPFDALRMSSVSRMGGSCRDGGNETPIGSYFLSSVGHTFMRSISCWWHTRTHERTQWGERRIYHHPITLEVRFAIKAREQSRCRAKKDP